MRINYLELRNYRRFEHVELEFPDGVIGIVGSNGAGKSTLVESIAWALFGNQKEIVRVGKESIRKYDAKAGEATVAKLEFTYAGEEYVVTREMSGKALTIEASLLINGKQAATGANEVSELIEKKLGMDYKSFFISVFAKQKDLAALSALSAGERRAKILRMLGIDRLDWVLEETGKRERSKREKVEATREHLIDDKGQPKRIAVKQKMEEMRRLEDSVAREVSRLKKEIDSSKEQEETLAKKAAENSARLRIIREANKKIESAKAQLASSRKEIDKTTRSIEEARGAKERAGGLPETNSRLAEAKKRKEELTALRSAHESVLKMRGELSDVEEEISTAKKELAKDEEEVGKGVGLPALIAEQRIQLESIENEISTVKDGKSEAREKLRALRETAASEKKHLGEIEELGAEGVCPTCERPLGEHHAKLKDKVFSSLEKREGDIASLEAAQKEADSRLAELTRSQEAAKKRAEALTKREARILQSETRADAGRKNLKSLDARKVKLVDEIGKKSLEKFDQAELKKLGGELEKLSAERDVLMEAATLAKKLPELEASLSKSKAEAERHEAVIKSTDVDPAESELRENLSEEIEGKRKSIRVKIDELNDLMLASTKRSVEANSGVREAQKELDSLEEAEKKLKVNEEDLEYAAKLTELIKTFRNSLIARIIPTLSQAASELLSQLTDGRYNSLTLNDNYDIFIEDGGAKHVLERFSGGESDLANLCLRLAISRVIAERSGTQGINLLVLDEIFGSQDAARKRNLMASFNELSKQFRQILLITHIEDVKEYLGSIIQVYKDEEGGSRAELAA